MTTIDNLPKDVRAYIYQNTNDLEARLLPNSQLSVMVIETNKKDNFKVKFTLTSPEFAVDATGTADNPFDAVKEAKDKMYTFLGDVKAELAGDKNFVTPLTLH